MQLICEEFLPRENIYSHLLKFHEFRKITIYQY